MTTSIILLTFKAKTSQISWCNIWSEVVIFATLEIGLLEGEEYESPELIACCCAYKLGSRSADPSPPVSISHQIQIRLRMCCIRFCTYKKSYLNMLEPIPNQALRLCLRAFRTSPATSLHVVANELPLVMRLRKLSLQYVLKYIHTYISFISGTWPIYT